MSVTGKPEVYPITWAYAESDPAMMLWTSALARWGMQLPQNARILELGCAETDFLERLVRFNPGYQVTGIDARLEGRQNVSQGNAMDPDLFRPGTFDAVIMLGALEHFGLGFYGDPVHADGDIETMCNIAEWLKPGGWVYFDVPSQPTYRVAENRHFRMYSPASVGARLLGPDPGVDFEWLRERARAYSLPEPHAGTWCDEPTEERAPYWFCAVLADKQTA